MGKRREVHCKHLLLNQWINVGDGKVIVKIRQKAGDDRKYDAHFDGSRLEYTSHQGTEYTATQEGDNVLVWSNGSRWQREEVCTANNEATDASKVQCLACMLQ